MRTGDLFTLSITVPQRRSTNRAASGRAPIVGERFVGKKELRQLVSISPQHIDRMEKAGLFPPRVRLGPGRVAWVLSEVTAWMNDKIAGRSRDWRRDVHNCPAQLANG